MTSSDGVIGLGFNELSSGYLTVIETLKLQGLINEAIFSIYLSDNLNEDGSLSSNIMIGGYNLEKYTVNNTMTYINTVQNGGY